MHYTKILIICIFFISSAQAAKPKLTNDTLPVPLISQATNYSCGAGSLLSILLYWGAYDGPEFDLFSDLGTTERDGTSPQSIVRVAQQYKLKARFQENTTREELADALKAGQPVILDIQAWRGEERKHIDYKDDWEDGHYVVLVGMDKHNVYLMDPSVRTSYSFIPWTELLERWHDYEIINRKEWRNHQLAIFIQGSKPLSNFPSALVHTD